MPDDLTRRLNDVSDVRQDAQDVRQDAQDGRADVSDVRQDAQDVRADASDVRQDAQDARADASDVRQDLADEQTEQHDEVQARQVADGLLHAEKRSDAQDVMSDRIASRVQSLVVAGAIILLCLGIVLTAVLIAARSALTAAERADSAGECATLLLGSVAGRSINPAAVELGCDTAPAQEFIDLGIERDQTVQLARAESQARLCAFAALLDVPPQDPAVLAFRQDLGCVPR